VPMRGPLSAATAVLFALVAFALPAAATTACRGQDLMPRLAVEQPALHKEILDAGATTPNGDALLWRIEKAGVQPSWLYGTIHLTDDRLTTFKPAVTAAIGSARVVALEVADLSREALAQAMGRSAQLLIDPAGGIDKVLSGDDLQVARRVLEEAGLPYQLLGMVRPWFVYTLLAVPACERARSAAGLKAVDSRIGDLAKSRGTPVVGLETVEDQLRAMAGISAEEQAKLLRASVKMVDRIDDLTETLVTLYLQEKIGLVWPLNLALAREANLSNDAFRGFESTVLIGRNYKMRDALVPLLADGGVFAAVGALHLVGNEGLVSLLRQSGYTVTAVR
jgi:uncharacterized protein YbaP (TraB family)